MPVLADQMTIKFVMRGLDPRISSRMADGRVEARP